MVNLSEDESVNLEILLTADEMHAKTDSLQDLAQVSARRGCAVVDISQQLNRQRNGIDPFNLSATRTESQSSSKSKDTQAYVERETSPTSQPPTDPEDNCRKDTDTMMATYGCDSVHSSISDQSTDSDMLRAASSTIVNAALVEGIGSHLLHIDASNSPEAQLDPLSLVQYKETFGLYEMNEGTYGENMDGSTVSTASSRLCSLYVLCRIH